jgi:hypothetical protein
MSSTVSNKCKFLLAKKVVDFSADSFKAILMASGFVFNQDTHTAYADVSASELATGYGYTRNTKTLSASPTITEDTTNDRCSVVWANVTWTASGGSIGPTPGMIIFDDTVTTPTADPIIGYIDFGGEQTQADGGVATISNVEFRLT